jgi:hypothetical protein
MISFTHGAIACGTKPRTDHLLFDISHVASRYLVVSPLKSVEFSLQPGNIPLGFPVVHAEPDFVYPVIQIS